MEKKPKITRIGGIYCKSPLYVRKRPLWGLSRCVRANKDDYHVLIQYGETIKF